LQATVISALSRRARRLTLADRLQEKEAKKRNPHIPSAPILSYHLFMGSNLMFYIAVVVLGALPVVLTALAILMR
jgi:hypothetical protein